MKIILKTDIEGLGDLGDVVEVKPGYARNYLFPKKLAMHFNEHNLGQIKVKREKHQQKIQAETMTAMEKKAKIDETVVTFSRQSGKKDTLFGSVKTGDIAQELASLGFEVDKKNIGLEQPIKSLGEYQVPVKLYKEVVAQLKVTVTSENQPPEETETQKTAEDEPVADSPEERTEQPSEPAGQTSGEPESPESESPNPKPESTEEEPKTEKE